MHDGCDSTNRIQNNNNNCHNNNNDKNSNGNTANTCTIKWYGHNGNDEQILNDFDKNGGIHDIHHILHHIKIKNASVPLQVLCLADKCDINMI